MKPKFIHAILTNCFICTAVTTEARSALDRLAWQQLPSLPHELGVAGPFARVHNGGLIIADGANFPLPVWESGKVWQDRIYVLVKQCDGSVWKDTGRLSRPIAYRAAIFTADGVVCMGGNDDDRTSTDVFLLRWNPNSAKVTRSEYPQLPAPCAFGQATRISETIYRVGGQEGPELDSAVKSFWVIIVGGIGPYLSSHAADQAIVQRYMATPNKPLAARLIWTNAILSLLATILFFGIGLALFAYYHSHPSKLNPTFSTDHLFPLFIASEIPIGMAGLIVAGIFAATQSTIGAFIGAEAVLFLWMYTDVNGYLDTACGISTCLVVGYLTSFPFCTTCQGYNESDYLDKATLALTFVLGNPEALAREIAVIHSLTSASSY